MESKQDKQWAAEYLLDSLNAPAPHEETGPGSHFVTAPTKKTASKSSSKASASASVRPVGMSNDKTGATSSVRSSRNPYRSRASSNPSSSPGVPTPTSSTGPDREAFPKLEGSRSPSKRSSTAASSTQVTTSTRGIASSTTGSTTTTRARRASSLNQRYPGDQTHQPLDMIKQAEKQARRAPHMRKGRQMAADLIDTLDDVSGRAYHHEGPYDAALFTRNMSRGTAPLEAVADTNAEALKATAPERILDSLQKHYPLDGVAAVPPGVEDEFGRRLSYQEGEDMMTACNPEGGAYKRWADLKYLPEDYKGKGEPSFSLERALKAHKQQHRRNASDGPPYSGSGIEMEMQTRPARASSVHNHHQSHHLSLLHHHRNKERVASASADRASVSGSKSKDVEDYATWEGVKRSDSGAGKLRRRLGSLRLGKE